MIAGRLEGTPGKNYSAHSEKTQCSFSLCHAIYLFIMMQKIGRNQTARSSKEPYVCAAAVIRQIQCDFSLESLFCVIYQARGHLGNPRAAKKTQTLERFQFSNSSLHTSQRFVHVYENLRMRLSSPSALLLYFISHLSLLCVCCRRNYCCVSSAFIVVS